MSFKIFFLLTSLPKTVSTWATRQSFSEEYLIYSSYLLPLKSSISIIIIVLLLDFRALNLVLIESSRLAFNKSLLKYDLTVYSLTGIHALWLS